MAVVQSPGDLDRDGHDRVPPIQPGFAGFRLAFEQRREVRPLRPLARVIRHPRVDAAVVKRTDVRVGEASQGEQVGREAGEKRRIAGDIAGDDFQRRELARAVGGGRLVHDADAAPADFRPQNPIAQSCARHGSVSRQWNRIVGVGAARRTHNVTTRPVRFASYTAQITFTAFVPSRPSTAGARFPRIASTKSASCRRWPS